jgi:hypothetical protein
MEVTNRRLPGEPTKRAQRSRRVRPPMGQPDSHYNLLSGRLYVINTSRFLLDGILEFS